MSMIVKNAPLGYQPRLGRLDERFHVKTTNGIATPSTTTTTYFTVSGGAIEVLRLWGQVTTVMAAEQTRIDVIIDVSAGTSGTVASALDITGDEVGTLYIVEGDGSALVGVNAGTGFISSTNLGVQPFIVAPDVAGTSAEIDIRNQDAANSTGRWTWHLHYRKLDETALVVANV